MDSTGDVTMSGQPPVGSTSEMWRLIGSTAQQPGREEALTSIAASLRAGRHVIGVLGGPRTGKSAVAASLITAARDLGCTVAAARGHISEEPRLLASRIARQLGVSAARRHDIPELVAAVRGGIRRLTEDGARVVVVLEDIHFCHPSDLILVDELVLAGTARQNLLVLLTSEYETRPYTSRTALFQSLAALRENERCGVVTLDAMSESEMRALLMSKVGEPMAETTPNSLLAYTGADFGVSIAIADEIESRDPDQQARFLLKLRPLDGVPIPASVGTRYQAAISRIALESADVLRSLATWALPATTEQLEYLTGNSSDFLEGHLDWLEERAYVRVVGQGPERFEVKTPFLARLVRDSTRDSLRARIHERAFELLRREPEATSADRLVWARHVSYVARMYGNYGNRVSPLERSAALNALVHNGDVEEAEALIDTIPIASLGATEREALRIATAELDRHAGRVDNGFRMFAREPVAVDTQNWLVRFLEDAREDEDTSEAVACYERVPESARSTRLIAAAFAAQLADANSLDPRETLLHAATYFEPWTLEFTRSYPILAGELLPAQADELARLAYRSTVASSNSLAACLAAIGQTELIVATIPAGVTRLKRALRLSEESADHALTADILTALGLALIEAGDTGQGRRLSWRAVRMNELLGRRASRSDAAAVWKLACTILGEATPVGEDRGSRSTRWMASVCERPTGDAERILQVAADSKFDNDRCGPFTLAATLSRCADLAFETNSVRALESITERLEQLATPRESRSIEAHLTHVTSRLHFLRGRYAQAYEAALSSANVFGECGFGFRTAVALLDAGTAAARLGDSDLAASHLRASYEGFRFARCGRRQKLAAAALRSIGRRPSVSRRPTDPRALTSRETEIGSLAAAGLTDQAIADQLSLSRRTVTTHMQRLRRKLGIRSRTQLASQLGLEAPGKSGRDPPESDSS